MAKLTTEEFIKKAREVHGGQYDYFKMIYRIDDDVITISTFWDMRMNPNKLKRMI